MCSCHALVAVKGAVNAASEKQPANASCSHASVIEMKQRAWHHKQTLAACINSDNVAAIMTSKEQLQDHNH
jgi:hypothetical protein